MEFVIFAFLISIVLAGFFIWVLSIHDKVNELVDEINKIKQAQGEE